MLCSQSVGISWSSLDNRWILLQGGDMLLSGGSDNGFHFDLGYLIIQTGRSTQNLWASDTTMAMMTQMTHFQTKSPTEQWQRKQLLPGVMKLVQCKMPVRTRQFFLWMLSWMLGARNVNVEVPHIPAEATGIALWTKNLFHSAIPIVLFFSWSGPIFLN